MRKIEDLLSFKINLDVQRELECQTLFDNRREKVEEESLFEEYDENLETVSWESIENSSWGLMKTSGMNWKLFSIWLESLIYIDGWDNTLYCFEALKAVLSSKIDMLLKQHDKVGSIEFMDKAISRAMLLQPIKDEDGLFQYLNYKKTNPQKLYDILATFDRPLYEDLMVTYKKSVEIISQLPFLTKEVHLHFAKILDVFNQLNSIIFIYEENFIEDEEDDEEQSSLVLSEGKAEHKDRDKESAFKSIAEALELLQQLDHQNISIPLLRKIMRWKDKSMSEILNEINDKEGAYFILTFLMD